MKSIKAKFLLILCVVFLIVCLGFGSISFLTASNAIETVAGELMTQMVAESSKVIDAKLKYDFGILNTVANGSLLKDPQIPFVDKAEYLDTVAKREGFTSFGIGDLNGMAETLQGAKIDLSQRDYYQKALKGENVVTDPIISKVDGALIVNYAVPIKDNNDKIIGVLVGARDGDELSNITNEIHIASTGKAYMINKTGATIAHYDQDKVINQDNPIKTAETDSSFEKLASITKSIIKGDVGFSKYTYNDVERYVSYSPVANTDWFLAVIVPKDEILSTLDTLKTSMIIISIVFLFVGLITTSFAINFIVKKIKSITSQINELSKGDFSISIEVDNKKNADELSVAQQSLHIMQNSIRNMISAIKESSQTIAEQSKSLNSVSQQMASASESISFSVQETSKGINSQAEGLFEINENVSSFGIKIDDIVKNIDDIDSGAKGINQLSTSGNENMNYLIVSINKVNKSFLDFSQKYLVIILDKLPISLMLLTESLIRQIYYL